MDIAQANNVENWDPGDIGMESIIGIFVVSAPKDNAVSHQRRSCEHAENKMILNLEFHTIRTGPD